MSQFDHESDDQSPALNQLIREMKTWGCSMERSDFDNLKYGNVIMNNLGTEFIVQHVARDAEGKATHVGVIQAVNATEAITKWSVVSKRGGQTYLKEIEVDGKPMTILAGRTLPAESSPWGH